MLKTAVVTMHVHNLDPGQAKCGKKLDPDEIIETEDFYNASTGLWMPVPRGQIGRAVGDFPGLVVVRPED